MATIIENLFVAIRADSKGLDKDLKGVLGKFKKLEDVGRNLSLKLSLPILALSGIILKMAGDFESAMNTVAAKSGATGKEFQKLEDLAKSLGATTRFSATQAAEGMAFLAQAGFNTNQILAALPATLNLASAGNLELARAADIASNVLKGFRLPAEEAGRAADVLALAAARTNTDVEELGSAMSRVAPVAVDLGISMEETAAAIGALSDAGVKGFRAGTALRAIFAKLAGATGNAAKAMKKLKINTLDFEGKFVGLPALMEQFARAERNAANEGEFFADKVKIFGAEMVSSAGILINKGGPALRSLAAEFEKAGGASQRMTDIMERGFVGAIRVLRSALESLAIAIADTGFLKFAENLARGLAEVVRELAAFSPATLRFVGLMAGIVGAIGPVLLGIGLFGKALIAGKVALLAFVGGPIGAAALALGTLGAAFLLTRDNSVEALEGLGDFQSGVAEVFRRVRKSIAGAFTGLGDAIANELNSAAAAIRALVEDVAVLEDIVVKIQAFILLVQAFPKAIQGVVKGVAADFLEFGRNAALVQTALELMKQAAFDAVVASGGLRASLKDLGLEAGVVSDKVGGAGDKFKSFSQKVADSVQSFRDAAEAARVSAAAWNIWADVLDKVTPVVERFTQLGFLMVIPLKAVDGALQRAGAAVRQAAADFKSAGPPVLTMAGNLQTVASQGDKVRLALSAIPLELAKLTPGQALLKRIIEALKAGKEEAGSFGEAMRLLAFDSDFAELSLEDQARAVDELREQWREFTGEAEKTRAAQEKLNAAIDDVSGILADAVLGFVSLGEAMKNFAINVVRDIVQSAFKALLQDMIKQDDAIQKLIKSWKDFINVLGGGGGKKKTPNVGDVITGGDTGPTGGGVIPTLNLITGAISAISDVIANFQLSRIESSLNFIELNTRQTARALIGDSAERVRGLLASETQTPTQVSAPPRSRQGFAIPSIGGFLFPAPTLVKKAFGGKEQEAAPAAAFADAGIGITGQLFALQDFASAQLGQLEFQTDSLDTLKDQAGRREGLLIAIRDSLTGLSTVATGGAIVPALLGQIKQALIGSSEGVDLISEIRNQVAAVRQHFVYDRDIVTPIREQSRQFLEEILKELKLISSKPTSVPSVTEFTQAQFRSQLNLGEAIP